MNAVLTAKHRAPARGLSLVELMVGVTVGLFIVAASTVLVSTQLSENRKLLLETQVQQDLRAAADIITRDLRRSGSNAAVLTTIWTADTPAAQPAENTLATVQLGQSGEVVSYAYSRSVMPTTGYGFSLSNGTIQRRIGVGTPQALTDRNTLRVTGFTVTPRVLPGMQLACPRLCADGSQDCWPRATVQEFDLVIEGVAASDAAVRRRAASTVRQRSDFIDFSPLLATACP